ncbi:hypothetical protein [Mucilaginibacter sp. MD40]|uniref:hypothetical protein n=1 Tax=Mucilaginibacter sp. MD40 TaxID=2029590 RepID=UPI0013041C8B|nr:hypothetical protein [Mucilaginibacter sp. MD40]
MRTSILYLSLVFALYDRSKALIYLGMVVSTYAAYHRLAVKDECYFSEGSRIN